jgi:hypothetical protein
MLEKLVAQPPDDHDLSGVREEILSKWKIQEKTMSTSLSWLLHSIQQQDP